MGMPFVDSYGEGKAVIDFLGNLMLYGYRKNKQKRAGYRS